jgi:hypothetical protein
MSEHFAPGGLADLLGSWVMTMSVQITRPRQRSIQRWFARWRHAWVLVLGGVLVVLSLFGVFGKP